MIRLFETHKIRKTYDLSGLWEFEAKLIKTSMSVPGCWEMHPDFLNYRGIATYRKDMDLPDCNLLLNFKGVSHTAEVFIDGVKVGQHYNAYTPFSCKFVGVKVGRHEIKVSVDNSFSESSTLHVPNDYFTYGGIIRPVSAELVPGVYIDRVECTPIVEEGKTTAHIRIYVSVLVAEKDRIDVICMLCGREHVFRLEGCEEDLVLECELDDLEAELWSPENPKLYSISVVLYKGGTPIDDYIDRVGFRSILIRGREILLNGKPISMKGFNRHEDHPMFGSALPLQTHVQDMQLILEMGANAVRTSHYPNDELFLDICDELGVLVWEESHARGLSEEGMRRPNFDWQSESCIIEMIEAHYNHPSIVIWGLLNECASWTDYGRECYEKQISKIKNLDLSRPVTYATCHFFNDKCLDLADIVSFNIYSGWYDERDTKEFLEKVISWADEKAGRNKPVIISEFGGGAIYGFRDIRRVKWSEERQMDILEDNLSVYCNDEIVTGVFIWQFCDCRVTDDQFYGRPKTRNNKGIVDEYRRPKLAFEIVKKFFKK